MASQYFHIKQIHSTAGRLPKHVLTVKALGLSGPGDSRDIADTPQIRGMISSVQFLLEVTPKEGKLEKKPHPQRKLRRELKAKAAKSQGKA